MSFDLQPRLVELQAQRTALARLEHDLAECRQLHSAAAAAFARDGGRAALEGRQLDKPAPLAALEEELARLEGALPHARAARLEDLGRFKRDASAALRERHTLAQPALQARLQQAYQGAASAIAALAEVVGVHAARGIFDSGEHARPIRERLYQAKLPEAGLLHQVGNIEQIIRRLHESQPEEVPFVASANAAFFTFVVPPSGGQEAQAQAPAQDKTPEHPKPRAPRKLKERTYWDKLHEDDCAQ